MQDENDENENDENVCRPDVYWRKGRQTVPTGEGKFRIVDGGSLQVLRHFTLNAFLTHNIFTSFVDRWCPLTSQCLSSSHT